MRRFLGIWIAILFPMVMLGQEESENAEAEKTMIIEKRVEYLLENGDENAQADFQTLFDALYYFFEKPLDLNHTDADELESLGLLSDIQVNNLFEHIEKYGKLIRIEELQTIKGFDDETIERIRPFVKVSMDAEVNPLKWHSVAKNAQHTLLTRYYRILETQEGFKPIDDSTLAQNPNKRYLGSPDKLYFRYRMRYGNRMSIGITGEKDPGEQFFNGTQKNGFDFYSAHAYFHNLGSFKHLAIGDYQAQFGQGLTFWSGYSFGKTANVMLVKRQASIIRPYTSVNENQFLRGAAATLKANDFHITAFYSKNKIDANLITDTLSNEIQFSSLQTSGIHGTPAQVQDKNALSQQIMGTNIGYSKRNLQIGVTAVNSNLQGVFQPNRPLYATYRADTNVLTNLGVHYNYVVRNVNLFGEVAKSANGGVAMVNGLIAALDPRLSVILMQRHFDRDYHAIISAPISENTNPENETGYYLGMVFNPKKSITITGYYDQFTFPWLKYQVDGPSNGYQYLGQVTWKPNKKLEMYARIRKKEKERNAKTTTEGIDALLAEQKTNYRFNLSYKVTDNVRIKSRAEWVNYKLGDEKDEWGVLIYQDVIYQKMGFPLRFVGRYGIFDTESYDSRIYAYENDVLYSFTIPPYYSKGVRTYLMIRYDIGRHMNLWVKWGQYYFQDRNTISSGLNQITGHTKSDIKVQLQIKL